MQVTFDPLKDVNNRVKVRFYFTGLLQNGVTCIWNSLIKCFYGILTLLTPWLLIFLLHCAGVLPFWIENLARMVSRNELCIKVSFLIVEQIIKLQVLQWSGGVLPFLHSALRVKSKPFCFFGTTAFFNRALARISVRKLGNAQRTR